MPRSGLLILACALLAFGCNGAAPADVVMRNGNIYTANAQQPKAEAVAVNAGKIVFAGSNAGVAAYVGSGTKVIDLNAAVQRCRGSQTATTI